MNRRFTVAARERGDLHRTIPAGLPLKDVLCFEEPRVVQNDWTVRWRHRYFQINRQHETLQLAKRTIMVRERLDGRVALLYRGRRLQFRECAVRPVPKQVVAPSKPRAPWIPPADHPWRKAVLSGSRRAAAYREGGPSGYASGAALPINNKGTFLSS